MKPVAILVGRYNDKVEKRVDTFHPRKWNEYRSHIWPLAMVIAGIASAFGGIHCIGWTFTFPSTTERTLCRVASTSITSVPIALFLPVFLLDCDSLRDPLGWFRDLISGRILLYYLCTRSIRVTNTPFPKS